MFIWTDLSFPPINLLNAPSSQEMIKYYNSYNENYIDDDDDDDDEKYTINNRKEKCHYNDSL